MYTTKQNYKRNIKKLLSAIRRDTAKGFSYQQQVSSEVMSAISPA